MPQCAPTQHNNERTNIKKGNGGDFCTVGDKQQMSTQERVGILFIEHCVSQALFKINVVVREK
jgi:hypothetical protein